MLIKRTLHCSFISVRAIRRINVTNIGFTMIYKHLEPCDHIDYSYQWVFEDRNNQYD